MGGEKVARRVQGKNKTKHLYTNVGVQVAATLKNEEFLKSAKASHKTAAEKGLERLTPAENHSLVKGDVILWFGVGWAHIVGQFGQKRRNLKKVLRSAVRKLERTDSKPKMGVSQYVKEIWVKQA